jgi:hypothetical protein
MTKQKFQKRISKIERYAKLSEAEITKVYESIQALTEVVLSIVRKKNSINI